MSRVKQHEQICQDLNKVYEEKNRNYGNSFSKTFEEYGPTALLLRLDDKIGRLKSLVRNPEFDPGDESVTDTLKDLANYSIMGVMELAVPRKESEAVESLPKPEGAPQDTLLAPEELVVAPLAVELAEYSKPELLELCKYLEIKGSKKTSKEVLITSLMGKPEEEVLEGIDILFSGEEADEEKEA